MKKNEISDSKETKIDFLGKSNIINPVPNLNTVPDHAGILFNHDYMNDSKSYSTISFAKAGPRSKIFFEPRTSKVAIVTCGGLCPGINNVIRGLVMELYLQYGLTDIIGYRYGYEGIINSPDIIKLTPERVKRIHMQGGSILSNSRGHFDVEPIVDQLKSDKINILYCIGGDGTLIGAGKIHSEVKKRKLNISIIGIPKTIDNDVPYTDRTFGFITAVDMAADVIRGAYAEAAGAYNGICLVKLMGRACGYIAAAAALAQRDVDICLIPEVDFEIQGDKGILQYLTTVLERKKYAVLVVAEGAGKRLFLEGHKENISEGNHVQNNVGAFLEKKIKEHFQTKKDKLGNKFNFTLKYIDPSYIIRSQPANAFDRIFCGSLAQHAVHAAMAGMTNVMVTLWHNEYCYVPISLTIKGKGEIDTNGQLWQSVLSLTGQPNF